LDPKTNHVEPLVGDVVVVVHCNSAGLVVQPKLPQALHLLAILNAISVQDGLLPVLLDKRCMTVDLAWSKTTKKRRR
jgi:hypothetical protein